MDNKILFFPLLTRRTNYSVKKNKKYYVYSFYKQEIREDCQNRCVYCDVHEDEIGGDESMQLDHFRPQKYPEYEHLIHDPNNLVWSCSGCNRLKTSHWPSLGSDQLVVNGQGFIDPFAPDRQEYFLVIGEGEITPLIPPAKYLIDILSLNRFSRKRLRRLRMIKHELSLQVDIKIQELNASLSAETDPDEINELNNLLDLFEKFKSTLP